MEITATVSPQYPDVHVDLVGEDGNAFAIIGRVTKAMKRAGHTEAAAEFSKEAMSGDYNHLLRTVMAYVTVDGDDFDTDDNDGCWDCGEDNYNCSC